MIGRATITNGVAEITPTKRTDSASLSVALERDNFIATTLPVSAPVPSLTMTCPTDVNVPGEDNALVSRHALAKGQWRNHQPARDPAERHRDHPFDDHGRASTWRIKLTRCGTRTSGR